VRKHLFSEFMIAVAIVNLILVVNMALAATPAQVLIPTLPDKITFAGQTIPLDRENVREQFDAMFTIMCTDNRGQLILWYKRANRILPMAKKIVSNGGLPEDLAYLAVAESDLIPRAKSPSGAYGFWQFLPATGREQGLYVHDGLDERGDFVKSTIAACAYLKELHNDLNQDWFLAMAAYNNGKSNVKKMMNAQHARSYWDAVPIRETAIYVPRIVLIKTLFENPRAFGIEPDSIVRYPDLNTVTVRVTLTKPVEFAAVCDWADLDYRSMLFYNPEIANPSYIKDVTIPADKLLSFEIPKGRADHFKQVLSEHGKVE